ncbi:hypothetical protein [Pedobacter terrae]|uniref:hypothetical protein n=1 Tax=Pedobacter terrae TaxID=405671 RepID=UPI002FF642D1
MTNKSGFSLDDIFIITLSFAVLMMVLGLILMLLSGLPVNKSRQKLIDKISFISITMVNIGLLLFLISIAAYSMVFTIKSLQIGEYHVRFSRIGSGDNVITWKDQPLWFASITTLFLGFSAWMFVVVMNGMRKK